MANGIDRLERLFSKKKYAAANREPAAGRRESVAYNSSSLRFRKGSAVAAAQPPSPTRASALDDMHFPQPSFIRPKAARMVPRDDHATPGHGTVPASRPGTANRSMSVPEPSTTLPPRPSTATSATSTSPKYVLPPGAGATRSPHGPPVAYTMQARTMSAVTSPNRRTFDSRRSSGSINYNNYSSSATLSSSGSSMMSASTSTSHGSHPNRRSSYIETPCELSEAATRAAPHSNNRILAGVNVQRLPKRSSSLLQRRDVFVSPLSNLDTYQMQQDRCDSSAITISSGEVSPATIQQATPLLSSSSPSKDESQHLEPKIKIEGDDLHELQSLADDLHTTLKAIDQPLIFSPTLPEEQKGEEKKVEDKTEETAITTPVTEESTFTETPVLRRDSVFAPIVLPQNRPTSPSTSTRRRSRIGRRPMSLRYQRHLPIEPKPSSPSSVLMEPNLGEFLSLSDDDIAEDVPAAAAAAAAVAAAVSAVTPIEMKEEKVKKTKTDKEETAEKVAITTPRASFVAADVPPATPPKTSQQAKSTLALQKPLPPAPVESTPPSTTSPPVSPASVLRRRALAAAVAPASQPPAFQAPPPAFLSLLPGMPLLPSPMSLTLSTPPGSANGRPRTPAGEARMAAAFEIARIASQYNFDLAYIATIWPKNMAFMHSGSASASASQQAIGWSASSVSRTNSQMSRMSSRMGMNIGMFSSRANRASHMSQASQASNMTSTTTSASSTKKHSSVFSPVGLRHSKLEAQFLAAYGLATVRAPYSLSAPTHAKILNAERWLEFSEPEAKADEFSRGYGCAFYRGRAPVTSTPSSPPTTPLSQQRYQRRPSTDDCDADTEQDGRATPRPVRRVSRKASVSSVADSQNNRGIVFVAYRRKEVVDERLRRGEKDDLEALYRDVEALVDKILDVHMQQQRQAQLETQRSLPDVEDVLAAGFSGAGASCTLRQSRFLGVKAAA
ncbi:hypothetical protein SBRCBS47491_000807 [Sporothrix bragantina]|uniref:Uncharacterized protein n=1 Tax=Sporothrix bragantina TaxID=671064 RepID=A0ABP0ATA8_9PEZI